MSRPFADGDEVLLVDAKKRRYLVTLAIGGEFHTHAGVIGHDDVIGAAEGATFRSSHGSPFLAIRPTLADFVLKMPRGAQVIYPRTWARSSCSPTSSPAPACSSRGSGRRVVDDAGAGRRW